MPSADLIISNIKILHENYNMSKEEAIKYVENTKMIVPASEYQKYLQWKKKYVQKRA